MSYALVTGAAKGIGRATATELARRGYNLLLVDMDAEGLKKTAKELLSRYNLEIRVFEQNLSRPESASTIKEWSLPYHQELEVVVNNAGYGLNGAFLELSIEEQLNIIDGTSKPSWPLPMLLYPYCNNSRNPICSMYAALPLINLFPTWRYMLPARRSCCLLTGACIMN